MQRHNSVLRDCTIFPEPFLRENNTFRMRWRTSGKNSLFRIFGGSCIAKQKWEEANSSSPPSAGRERAVPSAVSPAFHMGCGLSQGSGGDQEPTCLPCPPTGCQLPWPCCLFQALHAREKDMGASSPRGWAGTAVGGILNGGLEFLVFDQEIKLQIHPTWGAFWQVLPTGEADPAAMAQQGIPNGQAPPFLPTWQGHGAHPSCPTGVRVRRYLFGLDKPPSCQDFKKLPQLGKAFVD